MQSEVKGVEEKQIHGWWIHLERFDGLRIASQAIPVSRESEWHCCSAKKKKNCSLAAKIRSQVKKAWWWGGYGEHDIKVAHRITDSLNPRTEQNWTPGTIQSGPKWVKKKQAEICWRDHLIFEDGCISSIAREVCVCKWEEKELKLIGAKRSKKKKLDQEEKESCRMRCRSSVMSICFETFWVLDRSFRNPLSKEESKQARGGSLPGTWENCQSFEEAERWESDKTSTPEKEVDNQSVYTKQRRSRRQKTISMIVWFSSLCQKSLQRKVSRSAHRKWQCCPNGSVHIQTGIIPLGRRLQLLSLSLSLSLCVCLLSGT
jgi:hypothetical protein